MLESSKKAANTNGRIQDQALRKPHRHASTVMPAEKIMVPQNMIENSGWNAVKSSFRSRGPKIANQKPIQTSGTRSQIDPSGLFDFSEASKQTTPMQSATISALR